MATLKEKQISKSTSLPKYLLELEKISSSILAAIKQMLNFNQPQTKQIAPEPVWKLLIYDRVGQDIISPLISIRELRELGVTLHM
jgi:hypothetical protein